ncbi:HpcH/HpaI aldolase family protein [Amycolatopsis sp. H20-H5]|uniref:HpcH/HpaI aldolase family protein n=1 Tax=Amycolatopsis sp. H20-H5 TaxID=3046309 RepID=UPI002DBABF86|nr:aldolase/citrate lyase family protein [Amycolatopsis sp. H20-H5]MEC3980516.1 aldolase/citrate lyase family protein [Amycolatopsis sp. H20-H5]
MSAPPSLRARLAGGAPLLATFNLLPSPEVVELIALAGFDLVIIDLEHGPHDLADLRRALTAAAGHGLPTLVRVRTAAAAEIGAVLDLGASGVLVPHVESAAAAAAVVRAARFSPEGERGANPWVRAAGYGTREGWFAAANAEVAVLVMVEGPGALAELGEIVALPGLDGIFLGPMDLSHALGVPGRHDHPTVVDALRGALRLAGDSGVAAGLFAPEPGAARAWWQLGARLVAVGVDAGLIRAALTATVTAARAAEGHAVTSPSVPPRPRAVR